MINILYNLIFLIEFETLIFEVPSIYFIQCYYFIQAFTFYENMKGKKNNYYVIYLPLKLR